MGNLSKPPSGETPPPAPTFTDTNGETPLFLGVLAGLLFAVSLIPFCFFNKFLGSWAQHFAYCPSPLSLQFWGWGRWVGS